MVRISSGLTTPRPSAGQDQEGYADYLSSARSELNPRSVRLGRRGFVNFLGALVGSRDDHVSGNLFLNDGLHPAMASGQDREPAHSSVGDLRSPMRSRVFSISASRPSRFQPRAADTRTLSY